MKRINIKYKFLLICFVIAFCFLTSCRAKRQETQKVETITESTKETIVSYKDTIVYAPKSETSLKIPLSDLTFKPSLNDVKTPKVYTQKNGNATAKVEVGYDVIFVTATCDSLAIAAKIKTRLEKEFQLKQLSDQLKKETHTGWTFWDLIIAFAVGFIVCFILKSFKII
nr:hypothetical protein [uncultured Flavobacterium sp.]